MGINEEQLTKNLRKAIATSIYLGDPVGFRGYDEAAKKCYQILIAYEKDRLEYLNQFLYNEIIERRDYSASKAFETVIEEIKYRAFLLERIKDKDPLFL